MLPANPPSPKLHGTDSHSPKGSAVISQHTMRGRNNEAIRDEGA